jgi:hypothetical protein
MPTSLRAYKDCEEAYSAAASDRKGARIKLGTYESAVQMRTRLHYFRKLDREANATTYPDPGHPMHGQSLYDEYVVQIMRDEDDEYWLYITPRSARILAIEPLSEVEDLIEVEGDEVQLLEDKTNG